MRVWNDTKVIDCYKTFEQSRTYSEFKTKYKGRTIGREVFRLTCCKCVCRRTPTSCIDIILDTSYEYQQALWHAVSNNKVLQKWLEKCGCPLHTEKEDRDKTTEITRNGKLLKEYLPYHHTELIRLSCCEPVQQPTLSHEAGSIPKMILWK